MFKVCLTILETAAQSNLRVSAQDDGTTHFTRPFEGAAEYFAWAVSFVETSFEAPLRGLFLGDLHVAFVNCLAGAAGL